MKILITGGAGFIGSHLSRNLTLHGHEVTILDNLSPQIHGNDAKFPEDLTRIAKCVNADICDSDILADVLTDVQIVVHLAAETGTGQSMYKVNDYARTNVQGTATLLDLIVNHRPQSLQKVVVASSRAIYGEGKYECKAHGVVYPQARTYQAMNEGKFEPSCPHCTSYVSPLPTSEDTPMSPSSFYGITKQVQEQMVTMFASAIGIDACALRYQNVYGPGQSLSNSYTGLLAVFSNLVRRNHNVNVFEDGKESRDFVYIDDVVEATTACLNPKVRGIHVLNIGSGVKTTVSDVASEVRAHYGSQVQIDVTGMFRVGDIRHNFADISRINALTGFRPKWTFSAGLTRFLDWAQNFDPSQNEFARSLSELSQRGFLGGARRN